MIYDLTRPITSGMPVYPGDPPVQITPLPSPPWQISALHLGTHSGTHLDGPRHRFADGAGIDAIPPERLVGPGIVIDARGYAANAPIGPEVLAGVALPAGLMVVIRTGWEAYWGTDEYARHPYLSAGLAQALVDAGVTLVAIDAFSVDSTVDGNDTAHVALLGKNILIAENLCNLAALESGVRYTFAFLPLPLVYADGAPARVLAWRET
ncbi:cyclase [Chloroflexus islandicus]|uniref:Cyclase n=1 Tax=Chloroflexus islandicus TaxID=1707952 RepID=A0A178MGL3_9CHLR|nr:cyclase family protein [Chloroflexus islandicus]OAN47796.1 cyclase [Chloroflexus islandicus]